MVELLFREDPYLKTAQAKLLYISDRRELIFDKTVFYPTSGGQSGDNGQVSWGEGKFCRIETTLTSEDGKVALIPGSDEALPEPGVLCQQKINWEKRYRHMRMHTALHLLSVVIPLPVTGGQITAEKSRLDFDMPEAPQNKEALEKNLNDLIAKDYSVSTSWITDEELKERPGLVKTMSVSPPMGTGKVRLVRIGDAINTIDLQPCGGTHVKRTSEIGIVALGKIEKKGRQNRRVSLLLRH